MIDTETVSIPWDALPDDKLLAYYAEYRKQVSAVTDTMRRVEREIYRRLEDRGDRAIADNTYVCEMKQHYTYEQGRLAPLKEVLLTADLASVLTPAHDEVVKVPDKWHIPKILALGRRLSEVQAISEKAKLPGRPEFVFKERTTNI